MKFFKGKNRQENTEKAHFDGYYVAGTGGKILTTPDNKIDFLVIKDSQKGTEKFLCNSRLYSGYITRCQFRFIPVSDSIEFGPIKPG